jgi:hypothetical protein
MRVYSHRSKTLPQFSVKAPSICLGLCFPSLMAIWWNEKKDKKRPSMSDFHGSKPNPVLRLLVCTSQGRHYGKTCEPAAQAAQFHGRTARGAA